MARQIVRLLLPRQRRMKRRPAVCGVLRTGTTGLSMDADPERPLWFPLSIQGSLHMNALGKCLPYRSSWLYLLLAHSTGR